MSQCDNEPDPAAKREPVADGPPSAQSAQPQFRLRVRAPADTAAVILESWQQILGRRDVAVLDNFFESGGDSLLATLLAARLSQQFGLELSPIFAFEAPTIRLMASRIDELRRSASYALIGHLSKSPRD